MKRDEIEHGHTTNPVGSGRELGIERYIPAPPQRVYEAWTRPELLKQWFTPKPVETIFAETDVRPGGAHRVVMKLPDGQEMPHEGVYLEVVPGVRLVATSAFRAGWEPAPERRDGCCDFPVVLILTFDAEGSGTRYRARVLHWTVADREAHERMGFHAGWDAVTRQLSELVSGL